MTLPLEINTDRLHLYRMTQMTDELNKRMAEIWADDETRSSFGALANFKNESKGYLEMWVSKGHFFVIEKDEGFIGFMLGMQIRRDAFEISYSLHPSAPRRQGYGSEAVEAFVNQYLPLITKQIYAQSPSLPSIKILQKLGFQREGDLYCRLARLDVG